MFTEQRFRTKCKLHGLSDDNEKDYIKHYLEIRPILWSKEMRTLSTKIRNNKKSKGFNPINEAEQLLAIYYETRFTEVFTRYFPQEDPIEYNMFISIMVSRKLYLSEHLTEYLEQRNNLPHIVPNGLTQTQIYVIRGILNPKISPTEAKEVNDLFQIAEDTLFRMEQRTTTLRTYIKRHGLTLDDYDLATSTRQRLFTQEGDSWIINSGELNEFLNLSETKRCVIKQKLIHVTHGTTCSAHYTDETLPIHPDEAMSTLCSVEDTAGLTQTLEESSKHRKFRPIPATSIKAKMSYKLKLNPNDSISTHSNEHRKERKTSECLLYLGKTCQAEITEVEILCHEEDSAPSFEWTNDDITTWYGYLHSLTKFHIRYSRLLNHTRISKLEDQEDILKMCITAFEDGVNSARLIQTTN